MRTQIYGLFPTNFNHYSHYPSNLITFSHSLEDREGLVQAFKNKNLFENNKIEKRKKMKEKFSKVNPPPCASEPTEDK